jgi:hypothetical protein
VTLNLNVNYTVDNEQWDLQEPCAPRVVTNAEKERMISLAVFYGVDGEKVLEPAAGLLDEQRPARYRAIQVKDFVA